MKKPLTHEELYYLLNSGQGAVGHWPAESPWEIMLGAFLVQNTTWHNTEISLAKIGRATDFDPLIISQLSAEELLPLIYSSGFHKSKTQLIMTWFRWLASYDFERGKIIAEFPSTEELRKQLLSFRGIGNETADVLLLYVFDQPAFIADNYARKLFTGLASPAAKNYLLLKDHVESTTTLNLLEWKDFHGQILEFGKKNLVGKGPHDAQLFADYYLDV